MSLALQILAVLLGGLLVYVTAKIAGVLVRLWPDSKGRTIDEETIVRGNIELQEPLEIPLASLELFHSVVPVLLFFKGDIDVEILKQGLAGCLDQAPIYRGRVSLDAKNQKAVITAHNEGISVRVQSLKGHDIEHFKRNNDYLRSRSTYQIPIFLARLKLEKILKGEEALFRIVVTRFENGGTALGLVFSHLIFDATSVHSFLSLWSQQCQGLINSSDSSPVKEPLFVPATDRANFYEACGMQGELSSQEELEAKLEVPLNDGTLGWLTKKEMTSSMMVFLRRFFGVDDRHLTLHYSSEELALLKQAASITCEEGEWVGSNDALSAHVWHLATRLQFLVAGASIKKQEPTRSFYLAVDVRSRLSPPVKPNLIGNAIVAASVHENIDSLLNTASGVKLSILARKVRASVQVLTPEYAQTLVQWIQRMSPSPIEKLPMAPRGYFKFTPGHHPHFMLTSGRAADFYSFDFGAGRPQWYHLQGFYGACLVVNAPGDSKSCDIHLSFPPSITLDKAEQVKAEFMAGYRKALQAAGA